MNKSGSRLFGLVCLFVLFASSPSWGESKAQSDSFEIAREGYRFVFPKDHGAHPQYEIEWWYFTGNLRSEKTDLYGYELTFFRKGFKNSGTDKNPSKWVVQDIYLAHFAITDIPGKSFHFEEKISRRGIKQAGAEMNKMSVWIASWKVFQAENGVIQLKAGKRAWTLDLKLIPSKPIVIHGEGGISRKGRSIDAASHYYSITRLETTGSLTVAGKVLAVRGLSWMDHEFTSTLLEKGLIGWDWFSIQLEDGSEYMFYLLRKSDGTKDSASSGTVIDPDGKTRHLKAMDFSLTPLRYWKSEKTGGNYPLEWQISVPSEKLILKSEPTLEDQELTTSKSSRISYWEGTSRFKGEKGGSAIVGVGYVELTGYAKALKSGK